MSREKLDILSEEAQALRNISLELKKVREYEHDEIDDLKEIRDLHKEIYSQKKLIKNFKSEKEQLSTNIAILSLEKKRNEEVLFSIKEKKKDLDNIHDSLKSQLNFHLENIKILSDSYDINKDIIEQHEKEAAILEANYRISIQQRILNINELKSQQALTEQSSLQLKLANERVIEIEKQLNITENLLKTHDELSKRMQFQYDLTKKWEGLKEKISSPFLLLTGFIAIAINRFIELDKAAGEFRKTTGLNIKQTEEITSGVEKLSRKYGAFGLGVKEAYEAASALADEFTTINNISEKNIETIGLLNVNLGVSNKNAAGFTAQLKRIGNLTDEQVQNLAGYASNLADAAKVPLDRMMRDVAEASDEVKSLTGGSVINLIKASAQARRLGTDLNTVGKATRGLLNFNESINSELEASVLLGKNLSFMEARRYAFAGQIEKAQESTLKQVERMGDFNKLNILQQEALAKASGYSVSDLQKMIKQKKDFNNLTSKEKSDYEKLVKMKEASAKNDNLARDKLKEMQMQSTMDSLRNSLSSLKNSLAQLLVPVLKLITPIVKGFTYIVQKVGELSAFLPDVLQGFIGISTAVGLIAMSFMGINKAISGAIGLAGKLGSKLINVVSSKAGGASSGGGGIFGKISDMFKGKSKAAIDSATDVAKSAKPSIGQGFMMFMKHFSKGISYLGNPSFLKGVLGLALLGASIIPFAIAMKMFSGISWSDVFIGLGALAAFGVAAAVFGLALPYILAGSIAIAALGISLLPFSVAAIAAGAGMNLMADGLSKMIPHLSELASISGGLMVAAGAITALGAAFAAFGYGQAAGGLMSFVGNLLGGDKISELKKLAELGPQLQVTANAIKTISNPKSAESSISTGSSNSNGVEKKLDELISLLKAGAISVNLDGKKVSAQLASSL